MPTISVNSHAIYYEEHGQGEPLILIAGLGTSCLTWWKQIGPLGKRYRVITPDNRGIGDSSRVSQAFTVADLARDMAALIRELNIAPSNVLGISMGGFVALTLCHLHPELVSKLVLASTSAGGTPHVPATESIMGIVLGGDQSDIEAYCRKLYPALTGPGYMQSHPEDLNHIIANAREKPLSPESYLYQLNAVAEYTSEKGATVALADISAPTLILHGDADPLVPYPNGRYLADHIKGARLVTYPGSGHMLAIEAADQFNRDVLSFLSKQGG